MNIEKRKVGKKIKYYLAHSYREGSKVHKFRKYLGTDLSQGKLKERIIIAEKLILEEIYKYNIIQDPLKIDLSEKEISAVKELEAEIPIKIAHLSETDWKKFSELFSYNTNAIEGSRLNQEEVINILEHDKWPNKSKEDIAEAYGVDEAIRFILKSKEHITLDLIKNIHKIIFKNSKDFAGKFRKKGQEVVVMTKSGNIVHEGAPQTRINYLLKELIGWYEENKKKYPAFILAAVVHNQFENIHPFADGNGRVGRILLNNILIKNNFPPMNINLKNQIEYYDSLREYEHNQDIKPTIELYVKEYRQLEKDLKKVVK